MVTYVIAFLIIGVCFRKLVVDGDFIKINFNKLNQNHFCKRKTFLKVYTNQKARYKNGIELSNKNNREIKIN